MKTFADNAARTWAITVNVAAVKRVRELLAVNILEIADSKGKLLERLVEDPCLLCDVLWCLVKPEAEAKGISDEEFGRALGGDALDQATDALLTEIADFFPKSRREVLRRILEEAERAAREGERPGHDEARRSGSGPATGAGDDRGAGDGVGDTDEACGRPRRR